MTEETNITPSLPENLRTDWNNYMTHLGKTGGSVENMAYLKGFKKDNPDSKLDESHIPLAVSDINNLKAGSPIGKMTPDQAAYINSGLTVKYKNNPQNLNYPVTAIHGTDLEKHLDANAANILPAKPVEDPNKIKLDDQRKVFSATGLPAKPGTASGEFSVDTIRKVIKAAKHVGIDPTTAIAVALQESHLGNKNPENLGNVYAGYAKAPDGLDQQAYELAAFLKEKMTEGKKLGYSDEAHQLQMYNGMGKLGVQRMNGKPTKTSYYGLPVTEGKPLDLKKNPLYGKTIQDLRDNVIKKNPRIIKLLSEQ